MSDVPVGDRPLIEAALACREQGTVTVATSWSQPEVLLHALRYLDPCRHAVHRLRAALILEERLGQHAHQRPHLAALVYALNLGATPEAEEAWRTLPEFEKRRLSGAANLLFAGDEDVHLALCAMRSVGDAQSLKLIDQSVGHKKEWVTEFSDGHREPGWDPVRREARDAIIRRLSG